MCRHLILKIFRQKIQEIQLIGLKHINLKQASDQIRQQFGKKSAGISKDELAENKKVLAEANFAHLHNHTQFSVLQSTVLVR
jgi:DNA polymerase-3 subunit alpha